MVGTLGTAGITGLVAIQVAKLNIKAKEASAKVDAVAEKTEEVRTTLAHTQGANAERLESIEKLGQATHSLVNSQYSQALRTIACQAQAIATLSGKASDQEAADTALRTVEAHDAAQKASGEGAVR
jgi:hypothetical protein